MNRKNERIYKDRVYFISWTPGISGFQRWNEREYAIASGLTVKSRGDAIGMEPGLFGNLNIGKPFRLEDGHLPDYQPRATYDEACKWVLANPYRVAYLGTIRATEAVNVSRLEAQKGGGK